LGRSPIRGGSGGQHHAPEITQLDGVEDSEAHWRASKELIIPLGTIDEIIDAMNRVPPFTQGNQQLSSNSRISSASVLSSVSSSGSRASSFNVFLILSKMFGFLDGTEFWLMYYRFLCTENFRNLPRQISNQACTHVVGLRLAKNISA
jgi:hypothetical protein